MNAEFENDGTTRPSEAGAEHTRRDFLIGLNRWSAAVVASVAACATGSARPGAAWVNGGGGGSWVNRRGGWVNGGGSWVNRSGGGGGWINGGGGGGWVNRRGGGGAWVNR
jgi:hypothetical protein